MIFLRASKNSKDSEDEMPRQTLEESRYLEK